MTSDRNAEGAQSGRTGYGAAPRAGTACGNDKARTLSTDCEPLDGGSADDEDEPMPTRRPAVAMALALILYGLAVAPTPAEAAGPRLDAFERTLLRQVNRVRATHGLAWLRADRRLARAADLHSRDMLHAGFFAHASSDGTPFALRVGRHVRARAVGENLALLVGSSSPRRVVRMWLGSPGHRAVLLGAGFRRLGIGRRVAVRDGWPAILVTADFASHP